ncbi:hypothetical protein BD410DRAFT_735307, partial [Rickenella mellea]
MVGSDNEDLAFIEPYLKGSLDGKHIKLHPDFDHPRTSKPARTVISTDIDSVIYVTHELRVKGVLKIHTGPLKSGTPPIHKHNHVYVHLLPPPSETQRSMKLDRDNWETRRTPLSQIPNTHFGEMGDFKVAIFFPRLMHQDTTSRRRWVTRVPDEVHDLFLDEVLYPALQWVARKHQGPYVNVTREGMRRRNGPRDAAPDKLFLVNNVQLIELQEKMDDIIAKDIDDQGLAMFGSYFLVGDIRGSKLLATKSTEPWADDKDAATAFDVLCKNFPGLDWDHMMKPKKGALYMDFGIAIHPDDDKTPYVGLWSLHHLRASYHYAGFLKGNVHHAAQLRDLGGLQAEMSKGLEYATHINFRSSYCLGFEVVRRPGKQVYSCDDGDAYTANQTYQRFMENQLHLFKLAQTNNWGVRDEIRASGLAVQMMLKGWRRKVKEFMKWNSIVWVPSRVWFGMLMRRLRAIRATQFQILRMDPQPTNLAIVSSVLMHMVRALTITPVVMKAYISAALKDLHQGEKMDTWGIFFLKCLDLQDHKVLPDVEKDDDPHILQDFVGAIAQRTLAQRRMAQYAKQKGIVNDSYPIGQNPTWEELESEVKNMPQRIMGDWDWDNACDAHADAARLFVKMSKSFWEKGFQKDHFLPAIQINITCLEDAMKSWSIQSIINSVISPHFLASNANYPGSSKRGKQDVPFEKLREQLYFCPPSTATKPNTKWRYLVEGGYLRDYHQYIRDHTPEDVWALDRALNTIFMKIQCLPSSSA